MIKIENVVLPSPEQWQAIIMGLRNPKNSWAKSDSDYRPILCSRCDDCETFKLETWGNCDDCEVSKIVDAADGFMVGPNDHKLMTRLAKGGPVHAKYRRMIPVYLDITAPLYWWKEFDTYKVGTVANSCSTMHKIHDKEFTREDFSREHLLMDSNDTMCPGEAGFYFESRPPIDENLVWSKFISPMMGLEFIIKLLNANREAFIETDDKKYWWQMIQLLPSSYNQRRTIMLNYEVLYGMYKWRKNHKLDEWVEFCKWIESLPYSELITGAEVEEVAE